MQLFHFWSRELHPVQNLMCTKFHENQMIFHSDMAIYRFPKYRPSAILELFYHHTRPPTKSLLLAAAACQISCQSDTQIWRYSYLNFFAYLAWNAYSGPQNGGFGELWIPKCDYSSSRPPKGTSLRKSASFKLSTVKIRWGVWPVGELTECVTDTQVNLYSVHALHWTDNNNVVVMLQLTGLNGSTMMPTNLSSAVCDVALWPPDPQSCRKRDTNKLTVMRACQHHPQTQSVDVS